MKKFGKGLIASALVLVIIVLLGTVVFFFFKKSPQVITKEVNLNSDKITPSTPTGDFMEINSMSELQEFFKKAQSPKTEKLIGSWVLVTHIATAKFYDSESEGPDHVSSNITGIKRDPNAQHSTDGIQARETKGILEWKIEFNYDTNDNLQVASEAVGTPFKDISLVSFDLSGDISFLKSTGGDNPWIFNCRIADDLYLVCLLELKGLEGSGANLGVVFLKIKETI